METVAEGREYVTVEEYVRLTSLSDKTVRRRIRDGSIIIWQPGGPGTRILIPAVGLPSRQPAVVQATQAPVAPSQARKTNEPIRASRSKGRWRRTS
jgi:hypothetical protein